NPDRSLWQPQQQGKLPATTHLVWQTCTLPVSTSHGEDAGLDFGRHKFGLINITCHPGSQFKFSPKFANLNFLDYISMSLFTANFFPSQL
ncbi:hypothetical protein LDENG_00183560, partial [Lucifuga dentata]